MRKKGREKGKIERRDEERNMVKGGERDLMSAVENFIEHIYTLKVHLIEFRNIAAISTT